MILSGVQVNVQGVGLQTDMWCMDPQTGSMLLEDPSTNVMIDPDYIITRDAEPWHFWSAPAPAPAPGKYSGSGSGSGSK